VWVTARAAHKQTGLVTSWIYHATLVPLLLFFPELYRGLARAAYLDEKARDDPSGMTATVHGVISNVAACNPHYVDIVGIVPLAYILSHPKINLYKSEWAKAQLFGFGLDSIPHALTAFSLVHLAYLTLAAFKRRRPRSGWLKRVLVWASHHPGWVAGGALVASTAGYETGEYLIHRSELRAVGGDPSRVAMEWSVEDTIQDILSNVLGGLLAMMWHRYFTTSKTGSQGRA
jgi:hypothetical protein